MSVDPIGHDNGRLDRLQSLHFLKAAKYSFGGFRRLLQEKAFREELVALAVVALLFILTKAGPAHYLVQAVLFLILASVEALNTAVEVLVDRVSPETSRFAQHAKDLGSFAVFCLLCANCFYALVVVAGLAS